MLFMYVIAKGKGNTDTFVNFAYFAYLCPIHVTLCQHASLFIIVLRCNSTKEQVSFFILHVTYTYLLRMLTESILLARNLLQGKTLGIIILYNI